jgi:hypothetical protein
MSSALRTTKLANFLLLVLATSLPAQTHKVASPERVTRAVGVYEYTGDLLKPNAARLVPVTIFINGHLEDAGVYLSRPAPFALQTGDVYSIERAGDSIGTLDLDLAREVVTRRSATDDAPLSAWYGYGRFAPPAPPPPPKALRAGTTGRIVSTSGAEDSEDRPTLLRREDSAPASSTSKPGTPTTASNVPAVDDDPERPTLRHRDPVDETKRKKEKPGGYVSGPATSLNDDPNRPSLRRGVPATQLVPTQLSGIPPVAALHQLVAVSDPANREPHIFTREWESSAEHTQTLTDLQALARTRIANYIAANHLTPIAAAPALAKPTLHTTPNSHTQQRKAAPKPAPTPLTLSIEDLRAYTLSYGGLPTFVYTVVSPVTGSGGEVYLTLVAQRLPSGELQVALASATDAAHLDRVPWMRPIDAVDVDWSHRASLLFELRAQNSRQFALYRLVTAQAEQTFLSGILQ